MSWQMVCTCACMLFHEQLALVFVVLLAGPCLAGTTRCGEQVVAVPSDNGRFAACWVFINNAAYRGNDMHKVLDTGCTL